MEFARQIIPICRAEEKVVLFLMRAGIIYIGEDNKIHVAEN